MLLKKSRYKTPKYHDYEHLLICLVNGKNFLDVQNKAKTAQYQERDLLYMWNLRFFKIRFLQEI